jgi:hypothetical protein
MQLDIICYKLVIRTSTLIGRWQKSAQMHRSQSIFMPCALAGEHRSPTHHIIVKWSVRARSNHVDRPYQPVERL